MTLSDAQLSATVLSGLSEALDRLWRDPDALHAAGALVAAIIERADELAQGLETLEGETK